LPADAAAAAAAAAARRARASARLAPARQTPRRHRFSRRPQMSMSHTTHSRILYYNILIHSIFY